MPSFVGGSLFSCKRRRGGGTAATPPFVGMCSSNAILLLLLLVHCSTVGHATILNGSCSDYCRPVACLTNLTIPTNPYEEIIASRISNTNVSTNSSVCVSGVTSAQSFTNTSVEVTMEVPLSNGNTKINLTDEEFAFANSPRFNFFRCMSKMRLTTGSRCRCSLHLFGCLVLPEGGNCSFYNQASNDDDYPHCRSPSRVTANFTYVENTFLINNTETNTTLEVPVCRSSLLYSQLNQIPYVRDWFLFSEPDYTRSIGGLGFAQATGLFTFTPAFTHCRNYVLRDRSPSCSVQMCDAKTAAELYFSTPSYMGKSSPSSSSDVGGVAVAINICLLSSFLITFLTR